MQWSALGGSFDEEYRWVNVEGNRFLQTFYHIVHNMWFSWIQLCVCGHLVRLIWILILNIPLSWSDRAHWIRSDLIFLCRFHEGFLLPQRKMIKCSPLAFYVSRDMHRGIAYGALILDLDRCIQKTKHENNHFHLLGHHISAAFGHVTRKIHGRTLREIVFNQRLSTLFAYVDFFSQDGWWVFDRHAVFNILVLP